MMKKKVASVVLLASAITLAGCNTTQFKHDASAAWTGFSNSMAEFGKALGEHIQIVLIPSDQREVERKTQQALNEGGDGQNIAVKGEQVQGNIRAVRTRQETRNMQMARVKTVDAPENMKLIGTIHEVIKASAVNVRKGPSTQRPIITTVKRGTHLTAVGEVNNGKWILVAKDGTSFGYIYHTLLKEVPTEQVAAKAEPQQNVIDLDALFEEEGTVTEEVAAVTECRDMEADLKTAKEQSKSEFTACKGADGVWEL